MSSIDRFENRSKERTDRCSRSRRTHQTFTSLNISPRRLWNFEHTRGWDEALFDSLPKLALPLISSRVTQPACILSVVLAMLGSRSREVNESERSSSSLPSKHVGESTAFLDDEELLRAELIERLHEVEIFSNFWSIWLNFFEVKGKFAREKNCKGEKLCVCDGLVDVDRRRRLRALTFE